MLFRSDHLADRYPFLCQPDPQPTQKALAMTLTATALDFAYDKRPILQGAAFDPLQPGELDRKSVV